jgi:hypothetical protein
MHLSVPAGVPILKNGFWREAGGSTWIEGGQGCISTLTSKWVECLSDGVCLGGAGFGDQLCEPYHGGAFCEVCAQDTYKKANGRCRPCDSVDAWSIATFSMVCILFCGACIVLLYTVRRLRSNAGATATSVLVADASISSIASIRQSITRDAEAHQLRAQIGAKHAGARRKASHIFNFGSTFQHLLQVIRHKSSPLRSIFNFMQVVTKISITFHIRWPPMMLNVVSCLEVLTLNLFDGLIPFGCFAQFNFHTTMLTLFVGVTLVNAVFLFLYEVWFRHRAQAGNHLVAVWIFFNYFAYINMVGTTFAAFPCVETPSGQKLLRRDLSIDCASDAYRQHAILAAVGMIVYVFGIPILFIVMLRQAIKETGERRYNEARLAILHGPYKFNWYWAEALICIEKVTLIGVLVFIRESNLQVAIGAAVAVLWLFFFSAIKPFKEKADNLIKDITELCQVMVLLCTLLIKAHHSDSMYQVYQVDVALVIIFCFPIVAMIVDVALVLRELRRKGIYGVTDDKSSTDTNDTNDDTNSDNNDDDGDDDTVASCRAHINAIAGAFDQDDDGDDDDDGACDDAALNRNGRTHGAMTLRAAARSAEIDDYEVEMCDIVSQLPSREGNGGVYRQASL